MNNEYEIWYNKFKSQILYKLVRDWPMRVQKVTLDSWYAEVFGSSEFNKDFKQKIKEEKILVGKDERDTTSTSSLEDVEVVKDVFDPKNWGL